MCVCLGFVLSMLVQGVVAQRAADDGSVQASRLRGEIERFGQDVGEFNRFCTSELSTARIARFHEHMMANLGRGLCLGFRGVC